MSDYAEVRLMEKPKTNADEKNIENTAYEINGYTVRVSYGEGKTFVNCMENAVKNLNGKLRYVV